MPFPGRTGPTILLIDNYDSFVHTLARYFKELGATTEVVRNDEVSVHQIAAAPVDAIVISPGPCTPDEAGISVEVIRSLGHQTPILGVCLGHQAIGAALGGKVVRSPPVHGRTSPIEHDGTGLFAGCHRPLHVTRYHSLIVEEASLPACLRVTARTSEGVVMALAHREWPLFGVQFHPESILSADGHRLLANFLCLGGLPVREMPVAGDLDVPRDVEVDFYQRSIDADVFRPI